MKSMTNIVFWVVLGLVSVANSGQAQVPSRLNDKQVESLVKQLEKNVDRFRNSLKHGLNEGRLNGTKEEDRIKQYVKDFDKATEHLRSRFSQKNSAASDVEEVLNRAARIDEFMSQ